MHEDASQAVGDVPAPGSAPVPARAARLPNVSGAAWGIHFVCPGCKADGRMPHHAICTEPGFTGPRWEFNGNLERPTISPSVLCRYRWGGVDVVCHSFIRDGRIEYLNDCTHSLAGKTVDLPPYTDAEA